MLNITKVSGFFIQSTLFTSETIEFLMDGDPSIKWQVQSDLLDSDNEDIHYSRLHVELEGWGRYLLDLQGSNGLWNESLMMEKYKSTLWVLIALKRMGIYPLENFILPCQKLVDNALFFNGGLKMEGSDKVHTCISGLVLGILSYYRYLQPQLDAIFHFIIEKQQDDGTWTCEFHDDPDITFKTTLAVLEGLVEYVQLNPRHRCLIERIRHKGHEFLLNRELYNTYPGTTQKNFNFLELSFPYFSYDILTVLDYFRKIGLKYDDRMHKALSYLKSLQVDGKWKRSPLYDGTEWLQLEYDNSASRFNTLRALRVIKYYDFS